MKVSPKKFTRFAVALLAAVLVVGAVIVVTVGFDSPKKPKKTYTTLAQAPRLVGEYVSGQFANTPYALVSVGCLKEVKQNGRTVLSRTGETNQFGCILLVSPRQDLTTQSCILGDFIVANGTVKTTAAPPRRVTTSNCQNLPGYRSN